MATFRKRGKRWQAEICINRKRYSKTFDTKAQARAWTVQRESELQSGSDWIDPQLTVADAFNRYARVVSPTKKGARWENIRLGHLLSYDLAKIHLVDLQPRHIAAWRDQRLREVSGSTVNRELNLISNVFTICVNEWQWLKESPTKKISRPKEAQHRDRRITDDEIERILHCLGFDEEKNAPTVASRGLTFLNSKEMIPHYLAEKNVNKEQVYLHSVGQRVAIAFLLAIETAMRAGELCQIKPDAVNGSVVTLTDTKNGTRRHVPLSQKARQLLALVDNDLQLKPSQIDANFRKARDRAGIVDLHFHDTRHEAITRLARKLDVLDLARMTGHRDLKMLMRYYNASASEIAERL